MTQLLIVDDHALVRDALRGVLKKIKRGAAIFEASDSAQAMGILAEHPSISLILLDLKLPDRDGLLALVELRERYPAAAVVVLSAMQEAEKVVKALRLGAVGYIPKTAPREVMLGALQLVFAGGVYIPPEILAREELVQSEATPQRKPPAKGPLEFGLSSRQIDVLALMMQGRNNKVICRALNMAEPTVKSHVSVILRALKVTNRTEAVIAATELGWKLPLPPET